MKAVEENTKEKDTRSELINIKVTYISTEWRNNMPNWKYVCHKYCR